MKEKKELKEQIKKIKENETNKKKKIKENARKQIDKAKRDFLKESKQDAKKEIKKCGRNDLIVRMKELGYSFQDIGYVLDLTKQRVQYLLSKIKSGGVDKK